MAELDGNCRTPIAGQAKIVDGKLHFRGLISKPDGADMIRVEQVGETTDAVSLGTACGKEIKDIAGDKFSEYQEAVAVALDEAEKAKQMADAPKTAA